MCIRDSSVGEPAEGSFAYFLSSVYNISRADRIRLYVLHAMLCILASSPFGFVLCVYSGDRLDSGDNEGRSELRFAV